MLLENKPNYVVLENEDNGMIVCYSYQTRVARMNGGKLELNPSWHDYSQTTTKHVAKFIRDYSQFDYSSYKEFQKQMKLNPELIGYIG